MKKAIIVAEYDGVSILIRDLLIEYYKIKEANVMSCDSVHQAREHFREKDISILVLDVDVEHAFLFLEEIRSDFCDTICIATSENSKHGSRIMATGAEFVARPFRKNQFMFIAAKFGFLDVAW